MVVLAFAARGYCQHSMKTLTPVIGPVPDLSEKEQQKFVRRDQLSSKENRTAEEEKELDQLYYTLGETLESVWDITGSGCSWYCGEGPYKVSASSGLATNGSITYTAENAHDFSFKNAWVEGVAGPGQGEYLEYRFRNGSPRITKIKIYNGYVKTEQAWKNNGRVKKLKVYENNVPFAILELKDTPALQTFALSQPMGRRKDGKDMILRFEILETYPGAKFEDTALTELFFDGIDVH